MKYLTLLTALALVACSTVTEPQLEPNSYNPHRISVPDARVADNTPGHVCCPMIYGVCPLCMATKYARQDSVCVTVPDGWQTYTPVPTIWGQGGNQR